MQLKPIEEVKTEGEAVQLAIDWQDYASRTSMYYSELAEFQAYFTALAEKFGLTEEFKENGII